jgi:hypothetical protein
MLLTLLIVWIVVVPTFVVGGLLLASHVLGRRTRRAGAVDVTAVARVIARFAHTGPVATAASGPATPSPPASPPGRDHRSVGATY